MTPIDAAARTALLNALISNDEAYVGQRPHGLVVDGCYDLDAVTRSVVAATLDQLRAVDLFALFEGREYPMPMAFPDAWDEALTYLAQAEAEDANARPGATSGHGEGNGE